MIRYYVIPVAGCDQFAAAEALANAQGVAINDIVFLGNDQSHVFRVPAMQGYEGKALVVCSNQLCQSKVDVDEIPVKAATFNPSKDIFVLDCSAHVFKEVFSQKAVATQNLTPYLKFNIGAGNGWWSVVDFLEVCFNNTDPKPVEFKPAPQPEPERLPEPEPEPEPESFTPVDYPLDELPEEE